MRRFSILCIVLIFAFGIGFATVVLHAQDEAKKAAVYTPSELQLTQLKLAQAQAITAQVVFNDAQKENAAALAHLDEVSLQVKKENGWAKDVMFDRQSLNFFDAPAKAEVKKPTPYALPATDANATNEPVTALPPAPAPKAPKGKK